MANTKMKKKRIRLKKHKWLVGHNEKTMILLNADPAYKKKKVYVPGKWDLKSTVFPQMLLKEYKLIQPFWKPIWQHPFKC